MQETLGELQDSRVLADFLLAAVPEARHQLPTLFSLLASSRDRAWAHWQTLQAPYLAPASRQQLRLQLLSPEVEAAADTAEAVAGASAASAAEATPPAPAEAPATPAAAEAAPPIAAKRSRASTKRAASAAKTTVKADDTPPAN